MTGVVDDTRRGVAAIAPGTDTPAGKRQLVDHLQAELDRAKALLKVSEQRNVMLAQLRCVVIGGLERGSGRPGSDGAITKVRGHGVVAMDGVNVVKPPPGYSVGKGIWE